MSMENLIRTRIVLGKKSAKGFEVVKCKCCNDYQSRGGFKFDGSLVIYHCFNCSITHAYTEGERFVSRKFRHVLNTFDISDEEIDGELSNYFFNRTDVVTIEKKENSCFAKEIEFPPESYPLTSSPDDVWKQVAIEYIKYRCMENVDIKWHLSNDKKYRDRLIIPVYRSGKLVYWTARSYDENAKRRYVNCDVSRDPVIFGYDNLYEHNNKHLFVTEGIFDAAPINGVCLLGSTLSDCQIKLLNQTLRDKVFVIDKDETGYRLGVKALELGYKITHISGVVPDINRAIMVLGKIWTVNNLVQNIMDGFEAKVWLETINKKKENKNDFN
jgi:hypothetical protein